MFTIQNRSDVQDNADRCRLSKLPRPVLSELTLGKRSTNSRSLHN